MIDDFQRQYESTMLWVAGYEPDDTVEGLIDAKAYAELESDCEDFYEAHEELIGDRAERAGHDFYLTRNHHGAGFWDGDWPEPASTKLTDASHVYGSTDMIDWQLRREEDAEDEKKA